MAGVTREQRGVVRVEQEAGREDWFTFSINSNSV
jgi:hypothetical protein